MLMGNEPGYKSEINHGQVQAYTLYSIIAIFLQLEQLELGQRVIQTHFRLLRLAEIGALKNYEWRWIPGKRSAAVSSDHCANNGLGDFSHIKLEQLQTAFFFLTGAALMASRGLLLEIISRRGVENNSVRKT